MGHPPPLHHAAPHLVHAPSPPSHHSPPHHPHPNPHPPSPLSPPPTNHGSPICLQRRQFRQVQAEEDRNGRQEQPAIQGRHRSGALLSRRPLARNGAVSNRFHHALERIKRHK